MQCGLKSQLAYVYIYICMCATSVTLRNAIDSLLTPHKCMRTTGPPGCIAPSTMLFVRSVNVCARPAHPKSLLKITIRQDVRQCRKSGRSSETASPQAQTAPERKSYPGMPPSASVADPPHFVGVDSGSAWQPADEKNCDREDLHDCRPSGSAPERDASERLRRKGTTVWLRHR